jgi:hypothetical protein
MLLSAMECVVLAVRAWLIGVVAFVVLMTAHVRDD